MTAGSIVYGLRLYVEPLATGTATHAIEEARSVREAVLREGGAVRWDIVVAGESDPAVGTVELSTPRGQTHRLSGGGDDGARDDLQTARWRSAAMNAAAPERASRRDEAAENIAVTLEVGRAVLEGDLDALVALVSEHFEGHPHARPDYVFRGPGGVREYWQGNVECNRQIRAGTRELIAYGDTVVAIGRLVVVHAPLGVLELPRAWVMRFHDGKLRYFKTYLHRRPALAAAGLADADDRDAAAPLTPASLA